MDLVYLIVIAIAVIVAVLSVDAIRRQRPATPDGSDSQYAVSTEGMKVCPKCGMGNLWTDRSCMSCQAPLKG